MPFKSDKQRRYMNWAASKGKIKQSVVDDFNKASKGMKLPEVVSPKPEVPMKDNFSQIKKVKRNALMNVAKKKYY